MSSFQARRGALPGCFSSCLPFDWWVNISLLTSWPSTVFIFTMLFASIGRMWVKSTSNLVWRARSVCFYSCRCCVPHFYSWPVKWVGRAVFSGCSEKCDTEYLDAYGIFAIWPMDEGFPLSLKHYLVQQLERNERHHLGHYWLLLLWLLVRVWQLSDENSISK